MSKADLLTAIQTAAAQLAAGTNPATVASDLKRLAADIKKAK